MVEVVLLLHEDASDRELKKGKRIFDKIQKKHHDQAKFQINRESSTAVDWNWIIRTGGKDGAKSFTDYATPEAVEEAMAEGARESFEKRLLDDPNSEESDKQFSQLQSANQRLEKQNKELQNRVSELESRISEVSDSVSQNAENIESLDGKTDQMIEQFTEVNERLLDRLDDIEEKVESSDEEERIRNRRKK